MEGRATGKARENRKSRPILFIEDIIRKAYYNNYLLITLLVLSLSVTVIYFQTANAYIPFSDPDRITNLEEQINFLEGGNAQYSEPNNTGYSMILFFTHKATSLSYAHSMVLWQVLGLLLFLFAFYRLSGSFRLTMLALCYPPLLINTLSLHTSFEVLFHVLIILLYVKRRKLLAFLLAFPYILFRHEGAAIYAGFLLYELYCAWKSKGAARIKKVQKFIIGNLPFVAILGGAAGLYMAMQYLFYGHPLANFVLNTSQHISLGFGPYYYITRILIFTVIIATSALLFRHSKLLFFLNSAYLCVYLYFGLFGFEYTFFNIQGYYCWLWTYTLLAIGIISGDLKPAKKDMRFWDAAAQNA